MKGIITKIFKLDKPLGRRGFLKVFIVLIILVLISRELTFYFFNRNSPWLIYDVIAMVTPFAVRRLKDINANKWFAVLFIIPVLLEEIFFLTKDYSEFWHPLTPSFMIFFVFVLPLILLLFLLFLVFRKGTEGDVGNSGFIRKNTLIIILIILCFLLTVFSYYHYEVYSTKKTAMVIIESLDEFKSKNGYYPEKIEEIAPEFLKEVPEPEGILMFGAYDYWGNGKSGKEPEFCIKFYTLGGIFPQYCSDKREWIDAE